MTVDEKNEAIMQRFVDNFFSDDESFRKKGKKLVERHTHATKKEREIINDIFITLCGYSLTTIIEDDYDENS